MDEGSGLAASQLRRDSLRSKLSPEELGLPGFRSKRSFERNLVPEVVFDHGEKLGSMALAAGRMVGGGLELSAGSDVSSCALSTRQLGEEQRSWLLPRGGWPEAA